MKHGSIIGLSGLIASALALVPAITFAQAKSLKDQLVGTWNIVSVSVTQKDGKKIYPYGSNSKGMLVLTNDGHFILLNTRSDLPKFASGNRLQGSDAENNAIVRGTLAYFGTYTVDEADKTFTTKIDVSTFPNDDGTEQKRAILSLTADELHFTNPAPPIGGPPAEVTVKRAM